MRKPEQETEFVACRVTLVKWVANYMHLQVQKRQEGGNGHPATPQLQQQNHEESAEHEIAHASLDSSKCVLMCIFVLICVVKNVKTNRQTYNL